MFVTGTTNLFGNCCLLCGDVAEIISRAAVCERNLAVAGSAHWKTRRRGMARTYRDVAIEEMLLTVEEAMSRVIDWWGDLPPSMKEAIEQFRIQLGTAIDSVEFVKRALDREVPENEGP
jgi:hypothetical protein